MIASAKILNAHKQLSLEHRKALVDNILMIQKENYVSRKKRSKEELYAVLGLTP